MTIERFLRTVWEHGPRRCDLYRVDGVLELRLYDGHAVRRLATCRDSTEVEEMAKEWRTESV